MKDFNDRNWFGILTEDNIEQVAAGLRSRLYNKIFAIATARRTNTANADVELQTDCTLTVDWTDRNTEAIRVFYYDDCRPHIAFGTGGWHYSFWAAPKGTPYNENGNDPYFSFTYEGVVIHQKAPCGDLHKYFFRVQREATEERKESAA